jgi:hypothetical protein
MQYRLHIDIPMPFSEEEALKASEMVMSFLHNTVLIERLNIEQINYRLGHDDDRQKSNYFMKDSNGHVNNKKSKITFDEAKRRQESLDELAKLDEEIQEANHNNELFRKTNGK